jgi:putative transposase
MGRLPRNDIGNQIYHVINRSNKRIEIFIDDLHYDLFEKCLIEGQARFNIKILAYIIMPNHFHLVLLPHQDKLLSKFMHWFLTAFTQRYHIINKTIGTGHVFQGRYKAIMVKNDFYLLHLLLYVERNALRAGLVRNAQDWRWSSLWIRLKGTQEQKKFLNDLPIVIPANYLNLVNEQEKIDLLQKIRFSIKQNISLTNEAIIKRYRGRPKKGA